MSSEHDIICRCEEISRKEILEAIHSGYHTVDGIKKYCRAGMGLCQGRSCSRLIQEMISFELKKPMEKIASGYARSPLEPLTLEQMADAVETEVIVSPDDPFWSSSYSRILYLGGDIWTGDPDNPWVEALVTEGQNIIFTGSASEALNLYENKAVIHELQGKMMMPGFMDTHIHFDFFARQGNLICDLSLCESVEEIISSLKRMEETLEEGQWLFGDSWNKKLFENGHPHKDLLDPHFPDRPLYLMSAHHGWVNSKALSIAGIDAQTENPENGIIVKDEKGEPTGTLLEMASWLMDPWLEFTEEQDYSAFKKGMKSLNALGITSCCATNVGSHELKVLSRMDHDKEMTMRVTGAYWIKESWDEDFEGLSSILDKTNPWLSCHNIKLFINGSGASPETSSLLYYPQDKLNRWFSAFENLGFQMHLHTTSAKAVHQSLKALEFSRKDRNAPNNKPVLLHCPFVSKDDIEEIRNSGGSCNFTMLWDQENERMLRVFKPLLTAEEYAFQYPMMELHNAGINVIGGSDTPVSQPNPLASVESAVTGDSVPYQPGLSRDPSQKTMAGLRVPLQVMLEAYTINAARAFGKEELYGSLEPGKRADMIILDQNLFNIDPHRIYDTKVICTIVDGKTVYSKPDIV